ncbi:hypothetical protein CPB86DRAFT_813759 [Serendipita vermifera]|nr:hypothetical protein CPB86DRAFT_813759 [Serendipita vermifera]
MYSADSLPGVLQNITYLQVSARLSYRDTEEDVCMPNLQTLSILYTDDRGCYPDTHPSSVGCHLFGSVWSFPNLINLEVTGEISSSWRMPFEEINLLFQNLGSTLEHLSYTVVRGRNGAPEWLSRGFWTHCVRIKTVYGYYAHLMERVLSQGSYGSIRVTLRDFGKPSRYWSDTKVHVYRKAIVWGVGHSLSASFGSFHMDIDWFALYKQLKAQEDAVYLAMISWLFGKFKQARQDLKDKYGDGLESIEGRRLTDWLDSVVPDPSKHLNAVFYRKREGPSHAEDYL